MISMSLLNTYVHASMQLTTTITIVLEDQSNAQLITTITVHLTQPVVELIVVNTSLTHSLHIYL